MERLPDEIVLVIFSFVPGKLLFRSVSLVCKRFYRLAYDCSSVHRSEGLFKEINLQGKSESAVQRVLSIITMLPSTVVKHFSVQDCTATWQVFDVLAATCKGLKILNLASTKGVLKLGKEVLKPFAFHKLLELNISGTLIDDNFIYHLSHSCKELYSLNISGCHNITDIGLTSVNLNLTLLNIAHCHFQFQTIVHTLREFDVQVLCIQGIHTAWEERIRLVSMFPSLEIGIPNICGFSLTGYHDFPQNLCFWCRTSHRCTFLMSDVDPDKLYEI